MTSTDDRTDRDQAETKSARTRSVIIDAALKLFRERGYDATTMRAIATEAGVSVGNAYYYFDSKEMLIQDIQVRGKVMFVELKARPRFNHVVDIEVEEDQIAKVK